MRRACKRFIGKLEDSLQLNELDFPLRLEDVADSGRMEELVALPLNSESTQSRHDRLRIGWVCTPPGPGSGGHTTLFRMVAAMIDRGHQCTLLLYDKNSDSVKQHERVIRDGWPWLSADIRSATDSTEELDAVVASSWESAHVMASRMGAVSHKFYYIQDYEPYFHGKGALYALAEDTYKFGFHNIALGSMVADTIRKEAAAPVYATVPFGCDTNTYYLAGGNIESPLRNGVVFYAKKNADRRGYLLAKMALEIFGRRCPDQAIHVYGDRVSGWNIPVVSHGNLTPNELNDLYNATISALVLSFTNISLVPGELIAAGNVPVMNDSELARALLDNPYAVWAPATPHHLALAMEQVVLSHDICGRAVATAKTAQTSWDESQQALCAIIESTCGNRTIAEHAQRELRP